MKYKFFVGYQFVSYQLVGYKFVGYKKFPTQCTVYHYTSVPLSLVDVHYTFAPQYLCPFCTSAPQYLCSLCTVPLHLSTSFPCTVNHYTSVPLSLVHLYTCTMYTCTVHHYVWGHLSLWYHRESTLEWPATVHCRLCGWSLRVSTWFIFQSGISLIAPVANLAVQSFSSMWCTQPMPVSGVNHFHPPGPLHIFLHGCPSPCRQPGCWGWAVPWWRWSSSARWWPS